MADHDGQGVPDDGRRQLVQVEEVTAGIVDADRAVRGVRHDVGHHHGPAQADAALGRELGGKRDGGRLQVLGVEGAEGWLGHQFGQVRAGRGLELHSGEDPGAGPRQRVLPPPQPHPGPGAAGGQVRHAGLKVSFFELNRSHAKSLRAIPAGRPENQRQGAGMTWLGSAHDGPVPCHLRAEPGVDPGPWPGLDPHGAASGIAGSRCPRKRACSCAGTNSRPVSSCG